ncbi:MOSC domain-containing protein [Parahaliea aestuarii]|uniref:MOSC domain-containing protein n=1 Tax=Parahaliea aestuarii TaxID=1852021 RepID=A0A5C9A2Q1_9GAMM|nr:MOSC N-terminal beta barrel domain-containing protein [Parahaliea aestuarii]TXS94349.1 MOSC domain-containing protein [Parahaliea aestuarii]
MQLSEINIYPVKSCAGIALEAVQLDRFGPRGDRRWMVVDEQGGFLSQRQLPAMALVRVTPRADGGLQLSRGDSQCEVDLPGSGSPPRQVTVWSDALTARDAGDAAANWLEGVLGRACRLVYMPDDCERPVDGTYARHGETVGFADGFPLLLISAASLDELNRRLRADGNPAVPMNRFRPNFVVSGCEPFAEDSWRRIRIGALEFDVAKPCARCAIPSIDQASGQRDPHINRALAAFRRFDREILFGQNLLYRDAGIVQVGDAVSVLE